MICMSSTYPILGMVPTADEFILWVAEFELDPWGDERRDLQQAINSSAICHSHGAKITPKELLIKWDRPQLDPIIQREIEQAQFDAAVMQYNKRFA